MSEWSIFPMKGAEFNWLKDRAECTITDDMNGLVIYKDNTLVGAVGLESWSRNSVTIHVALEDSFAMKHGFPEAVFGYVFDTCERGVIIGVTPANNERALRFNRRVGLVEIYRIKDGYDIGVDYVVQELRKENCKYLRKENGQEVHANAA